MTETVEPVVVQVHSAIRLKHRLVKPVNMAEREVSNTDQMQLFPADVNRCRIILYARAGKVRLADERNADILNTGFRLDDSAGTPYLEIRHTGEIWAQAEAAGARVSYVYEAYLAE